jgi:hypothetical protein
MRKPWLYLAVVLLKEITFDAIRGHTSLNRNEQIPKIFAEVIFSSHLILGSINLQPA